MKGLYGGFVVFWFPSLAGNQGTRKLFPDLNTRPESEDSGSQVPYSILVPGQTTGTSIPEAGVVRPPLGLERHLGMDGNRVSVLRLGTVSHG